MERFLAKLDFKIFFDKTFFPHNKSELEKNLTELFCCQ